MSGQQVHIGDDVTEFAREVKAMLVEIGERAAHVAPRIGPMTTIEAEPLDAVWRAALVEGQIGERLVTRVVDAYRQGTAHARHRMEVIDQFQALIDEADEDTLAALESAIERFTTKGTP